ncbi:MAG: hypothetical protein GY816_08940 [Cytophagales bacterium]|nr:hypothetical protein [Cytophagales bacterium]
MKPSKNETIENGHHYFEMNGKEVYKKAIEALPLAIEKILSDNNLTTEDIDFIVPHQPSIRIRKEVASKVDIPFEKCSQI